MLAERALTHLVGSPEEFGASDSGCCENCFAAIKLGHLLSRKLYKPQITKQYLDIATEHVEQAEVPEQYPEYANLFPLEDPATAAREEREHIQALYDFRIPADNNAGDLQTVALFGMQELSAYLIAEKLATRRRRQRYEFSRRLNPRAVCRRAYISGLDNAKVVSEILDELDMPSFVISDKQVDSLVPESRPIKNLGIRDEGIYMRINFKDELTIPWSEVELFDACKLKVSEQKTEKPKRIVKVPLRRSRDVRHSNPADSDDQDGGERA
ncbi:MAG: hypothetical protein U5N86_10645 [Planctomycetota bacterium]|nr:hypothetical protein [Planctomycetota bacterium]